MKTTPCCQPPGEPFDGKPRVIVVKEELEKELDEREANDFKFYFICALLGLLIGFLFALVIK